MCLQEIFLHFSQNLDFCFCLLQHCRNMRLCRRHLAQIACGDKAKLAHRIAHLQGFKGIGKLGLCHYVLIQKSCIDFVLMRLCGKGKERLCFPYPLGAPGDARQSNALLAVLQKRCHGGCVFITYKHQQKVMLLRRSTKLAHQLRGQEIERCAILFGKRQGAVNTIERGSVA